MTAVNEAYSASTRESEIDQLLDDLIAKILTGSVNDRERIEYDELVASRTRMMRTGSGRYLSIRRRYST